MRQRDDGMIMLETRQAVFVVSREDGAQLLSLDPLLAHVHEGKSSHAWVTQIILEVIRTV